MKLETIQKFNAHCRAALAKGLSIKQYTEELNLPPSYFYNSIQNINKAVDEYEEERSEATKLYNKLKKGNFTTFNEEPEQYTKEDIDTNDTANIWQERDSDGRIVRYCYKLYRRDKTPLIGTISREEMETIYREYSYYGDNLQQRIVNRHINSLPVADFRRVLTAFGVTKACANFAPHMFEEKTDEELKALAAVDRENGYLRKAEEERIKLNESLLKKYAQENIELKNQIKRFKGIKLLNINDITPVHFKQCNDTNKNLMLHLSDIHLGAAVTSGCMYNENVNYGYEEAKRRLTKVLEQIKSMGLFDCITINLLGDNIDCCGVPNKTARLDHDMPENMDPIEQLNKFIELITWFIESLRCNELCNKVKIFSVPCGNHGGTFEYAANKALLLNINKLFPEVETKLFDTFYGHYEFCGHDWIIMHGKDASYMKKGLPLYLNDTTKNRLYEWLDDNNIHGNNIHFIKGDLHSECYDSCRKMSYRNVLSLFGASDYSNNNFSRNSYGVSYELILGETVTRGTFENV